MGAHLPIACIVHQQYRVLLETKPWDPLTHGIGLVSGRVRKEKLYVEMQLLEGTWDDEERKMPKCP